MMNCRLDNAVSDIVGESGKLILLAILEGERDPAKLVEMVHVNVDKKRKEIMRDLNGEFREELIVVLREWFGHYLFYNERLEKISVKIYDLLEKFPKKEHLKNLPPKPLNYREDNMHFSLPLRPVLFEIFGTVLTQLPSVGASTLLSFLAVVGNDVSAWPTSKHFSSWLGLAPNPQISANTRKKAKTKKVSNLLTKDLKVAAMTAQRTDSFLGVYHRRLKGRIGPAKAKNATARKVSIILYDHVKNESETLRFSAEKYETAYKERKLKNMQREANKFGYVLTEKAK